MEIHVNGRAKDTGNPDSEQPIRIVGEYGLDDLSVSWTQYAGDTARIQIHSALADSRQTPGRYYISMGWIGTWEIDGSMSWPSRSNTAPYGFGFYGHRGSHDEYFQELAY